MPYGDHGIYDQSYLSPFGNQFYETSLIKPKNVFTGVNNRYQQLGDVSKWAPKKVDPDKFKVYEPEKSKAKEGFCGGSPNIRGGSPNGAAAEKAETDGLFGLEFKVLFIIMCFVVLIMIWYIDHLRQKISFLRLEKLLSSNGGQ